MRSFLSIVVGLLQLSLDLIGDWLARNVTDTLLDERQGGLSISGLATYQPFDGLVELKMVSNRPPFTAQLV